MKRSAVPEGRTEPARGAERPLRALIADDEPRARQFLDRLLSELDEITVVGEAKGGAETLALVARLSPDVVFLDIQMPDLSGLEVARHLSGPQAPVVVFVTLASGVPSLQL